MEPQKLQISILDPKVKGILSELQNLGLISIDEDSALKEKNRILNQLEGKDLLSVDENELKKIIRER